MKNSLEGIPVDLGRQAKRINKLEDKSIKKQKEKRRKISRSLETCGTPSRLPTMYNGNPRNKEARK